MDIANCGGLGRYYKESPEIDANDYGSIWGGKRTENIWDECGVFDDMGDDGGNCVPPLPPHARGAPGAKHNFVTRNYVLHSL